ncbi:MAG: FAD-binding oxidoreductase [Patescibacteria group bacterium]|nr:FAD-binding oxidoreductase [Patescibacteria group bacterium]
MGLVDDLKGFIKGDVLADDATRAQYSHDASLFEIRPQVVVEPKDVEDIQEVVKYVTEKKERGETISITARSGGTDMTGGALTESIVLEFSKYFNRIRNVSNFSAVVEPGVYYRDFEKETLKQGLLLPSYPASREICALGGMIANNSGGELTPAYGKTEKYVYGLKAVLSDGKEYVIKPLDKKELQAKIKEPTFEGKLYKQTYDLIKAHSKVIQAAKPDVTKNSAGYALWNVWDGETFDLTKLFVGSQGTLGIVTEIKVHLIKPKAHSRMVVIFLRNMDGLLPIVNAVRAFHPQSFESYDDNTLKLAIRFIPDLIKILKPKHMLKLAWEFLPEAKMALTGGFPKLVMLAEFAGDDEQALDATMEQVAGKLKEIRANYRVIHDKDEAEKYWVIRRESFNLLRKHVKDKRTAPFIDDFIVSVDKMPEFLPKLNAIMAKYPIFYTIAGHVGDGNFHIIPLMNLSDPKSKEIIKNLSEEVYSLIIRYKGSITAEHNDGLIRTPYLEKMYGKEVYGLFEEVKDIFDPLDIFNPKKKVRGDLKYAFDHLVKS